LVAGLRLMVSNGFLRLGEQESGARRSLQLDDIALGIRDIEGRALTLGTIARLRDPGFDTERCQMPADLDLVERLDAQAEMIEVARPRIGRAAAFAAKFSRHWHQVDQALPGAQLDEADAVVS